MQFILDRGSIDSLGEKRTSFRFRDLTEGSWRGILVTGGGDVALAGDRLWLSEEPLSDTPFLLGRDRRGTTYVAWLVGRDFPLPESVNFRSITEVGAALPEDDSLLASQAVALGRWHARDRFCVQCGNRVAPIEAGWANQCTNCGHVDYPRTDPVVIVRVTDGNDRILLAHNTSWDRPMLSLPAGYVEAGETPRRAIERELCEEVGVAVHQFQYLGAQPWPGPRSLMLAFHANTVEETVRPVPDQVEIDYAEFFSREEYAAALEEETIFAPRPSSIAASMLTDWLGAPLHYPQRRRR